MGKLSRKGPMKVMKVDFTLDIYNRLREYQKTMPYFQSLTSIVNHAVWLYLEQEKNLDAFTREKYESRT